MDKVGSLCREDLGQLGNRERSQQTPKEEEALRTHHQSLETAEARKASDEDLRRVEAALDLFFARRSSGKQDSEKKTRSLHVGRVRVRDLSAFVSEQGERT